MKMGLPSMLLKLRLWPRGETSKEDPKMNSGQWTPHGPLWQNYTLQRSSSGRSSWKDNSQRDPSQIWVKWQLGQKKKPLLRTCIWGQSWKAHERRWNHEAKDWTVWWNQSSVRLLLEWGRVMSEGNQAKPITQLTVPLPWSTVTPPSRCCGWSLNTHSKWKQLSERWQVISENQH